ncbi:MAG: hypothetical protein E2P02_00600 [Acidobacteria bacterium]|nr:MAG: hypothetical protein E2P02_00600 [Acidobacteriota bacterium]
MVDGVMGSSGDVGAAQFSFSDTGSLVYLSGVALDDRTLVWVDRNGREEPLTAEPRRYFNPRMSPDGTQLALDVRDQENDIWIWHFERETLTRFTFGAGNKHYPAWTPDGRRVVFDSTLDGPRNIYWKSADGTGAVEQLTESEMVPTPYTFSPDGERLVFRQIQPGAVRSLGVLLRDGSSETLLSAEYAQINAEISPDGGFLAYQSNESGRHEIYVRPFPAVEDGRWQISASGGTQPLWAPDGQELFYRAPGGELVAVRIRTDPSFASSKAEVVVELRSYFAGRAGRTYDISPDGKRFLMIKEGGPGDEASPTELILVQNWFEELERLVPTEN